MRPTVCRAAVALVAVLVTATSAPTAGASAVSEHRPGAPTQLTVDDAEAPLTVEGAPQFGWVVNDPDRGEVQSAYELVVSAVPTSGGAVTVIWGTGEVRSSQQSSVTAPGLTLKPDHAYTWTVRTWDRFGRAGPFAKPAHFDAGIGDRDWDALWIRRPNADQAVYDDLSLLRKEFMVSASPIVRARAYMSAGQQYDLRVNGIRAAHGPSFSYPTSSTTRRPTSPRFCTPTRQTPLASSPTGRHPGRVVPHLCRPSSPESPSTTPTEPAR